MALKNILQLSVDFGVGLRVNVGAAGSLSVSARLPVGFLSALLISLL